MITNTCLDIQSFKSKTIRASRTFIDVASEIIEVDPGQPFYVILTKVSAEQVIIPNYMIIAQTLDRQQLVPTTDVILSESQPNTLGTVPYKLSVGRETRRCQVTRR